MQNRTITCVIIDDDGVLRSLMGSILRRANIEIVGEATSAETGLNICKEHQPRLILLDINLPGKSGLELIPEILADSPKSRIVMVSGDAKIELVRQAMISGATGFVVKPFTSARLLDAVGRSMGLIH